ncbi:MULTISPECIES: DUF1496 domain-containing protein [Methylocaldum]|uniref:DUF1496 domain-containing protein n=1 Tax=unclassified Methylocaldum TaxID=2622260 RepID=UPI00098AD981|nr:DUF1496 domain-containing protein [Methylocaldum sp. 14B]MBP1151025.1 hypothetical protein [Methylocaldum sp. RMAD-M]MDV3241015.1 DUF1496 domain-containing protein [Methylocaldum sp.]MVF21690.1 DUF1496 domain-containing protein [Methylocaldum sp. BRCS4]
MAERIAKPQVGAPDPELRTSPILEEFDDDYLVLKQQVPGEPVCHFNDKRYAHGTYVCSGDTLLRCDYGVWIRTGSCDPDNP